MPVGTEKASLLAAAGAAGATNYFGDESDGALTTSGDVTYTVLNKVGSYDGDMVIKQYSALTISTGDTVTVDQVNRGLFIYVTGDCTINGTLTMSSQGGDCDPTTSGGSDSNAVGASGLQLGLRTASGSETFTNDGTGFNGAGTAVRTAIANEVDLAGDGTIFSMLQTRSNSEAAGATGAAAISTARGGRGWHGSGGTSGTNGAGGAFSGGAGSGAVWCAAPSSCSTGAAGDYGGAGTNSGGTGSSLGGGAGNPGGTGQNGGGTGVAGAGGIIWLVVKGNVTIASGGSITAKGSNGGSGGQNGGASGGGAIHVLYGGTFSNSGTISAVKGVSNSTVSPAGDGGINTAQVAAA